MVAARALLAQMESLVDEEALYVKRDVLESHTAALVAAKMQLERELVEGSTQKVKFSVGEIILAPSKTQERPTMRESKPTENPVFQENVIGDLANCDVILPAGHCVLRRLRMCRIFAPKPLTAIKLHDVDSCDVIVPSVESSCVADNLRNCSLIVCARQIRLHHSFDVLLSASCAGKPILEHSTRIRVTAFCLSPYLALFGTSPKPPVDFQHPQAQQSPNWSLGPETSPCPVAVEASKGSILMDSVTQSIRAQCTGGILGLYLEKRMNMTRDEHISTSQGLSIEDEM